MLCYGVSRDVNLSHCSEDLHHDLVWEGEGVRLAMRYDDLHEQHMSPR